MNPDLAVALCALFCLTGAALPTHSRIARIRQVCAAALLLVPVAMLAWRLIS